MNRSGNLAPADGQFFPCYQVKYTILKVEHMDDTIAKAGPQRQPNPTGIGCRRTSGHSQGVAAHLCAQRSIFACSRSIGLRLLARSIGLGLLATSRKFRDSPWSKPSATSATSATNMAPGERGAIANP